LRTKVRKGSGLKMGMMRKNRWRCRRKWDDDGRCRVVMEEG
jgi:hypothetical protein